MEKSRHSRNIKIPAYALKERDVHIVKKVDKVPVGVKSRHSRNIKIPAYALKERDVHIVKKVDKVPVGLNSRHAWKELIWK